MKWYCKKCKSTMESKTAEIKSIPGVRYKVNCICTESMDTDKKVEEFQDKHWKRLK